MAHNALSQSLMVCSATFFPPSIPQFHPHVNRHTYKHSELVVWVGTAKRQSLPICCVDLRISLLKHSRDSQEGEEETERNFFSSSGWCARVKVYIPSRNTCAKNTCISNTELGLCGSFSTSYQYSAVKRGM